MADFKEAIANAIAKAMQGKLSESEIIELIEVPPQKEMGDYSFLRSSLQRK